MCAQRTHSRSTDPPGETGTFDWDAWSVGTVFLGVVLAVIHAIHVYEMIYYGMIGMVIEGVIPFIFAGILGLSGPWLSYRGFSVNERKNVFRWMIIIGLLVGLLFLWALSHQFILSLSFPHAEYVTTTNLTAGALLGIVIGVYDVRTQRHRNIAQQEQMTSELQRSRLSVLNRILRHNIRNDMNLVQGICSDIAETGPDEIATQAETATAVVGDLHALSEKARRIDKTLAVDHSYDDAVDIHLLVEDIVSTYEHVSEGVTYTLDIESEVPIILTNERLLSGIINEIIENTAEHGGEKLTEVAISIHHQDADWVDIKIKDNGPGLPRIERESLKFGVERDIEHMSGIGLWFAKWGMEMLDGHFQIESTTGEGTTVDLRLPISNRPQLITRAFD